MDADGDPRDREQNEALGPLEPIEEINRPDPRGWAHQDGEVFVQESDAQPDAERIPESTRNAGCSTQGSSNSNRDALPVGGAGPSQNRDDRTGEPISFTREDSGSLMSTNPEDSKPTKDDDKQCGGS